jgi:hypothetical protein
MNVIERLEALLYVMNETQGEDSQYSKDVQMGIDRIKRLEEELKAARGLSYPTLVDLKLAIKTVMDVLATTGVYPKATSTWDEETNKIKDTKLRTEWQEGWNACQWEIFNKINDALAKLEEGMSDDLALLQIADAGWMQDGKFILNMNDTFYYGADCEEVSPEEYKEVARLFRIYGCGGLDYWVAEKRGCDPERPEYKEQVREVRSMERKRKDKLCKLQQEK